MDKKLKGTYVAAINDKTTGRNKDTLFLFEDGTYNYEENEDAAYGYFGNVLLKFDL